MSRLTFRFMIAILTFAIGIVLTGLWLSEHFLITKQTEPATAQSVNQKLEYKLTLERGRGGSYYYDYESTDGVKLMRASIRWESPEIANAELRNKTDARPNVTEILERSRVLDGDGRDVGERVVAVEIGSRGGRLAYVVWTRGNELCWIESLSLRHVLELERQGRF